MARAPGRGRHDRHRPREGRLPADRHRGPPGRVRDLSAPGLVLQHGPQGPAARLAEWLRARGREFELNRAWADPVPTDPRRHAFIVSLGAAQSANDLQPAWIPDQVALLRDAVAAGVPVLGLCWGGQALSLALGGRVGPASVPERGWLTVPSSDPGLPEGPWLHYHYEAFTVPAGADELARSPAGPAAFRLGPHLGLQFHPEATAAIGEIWGHSDPQMGPADVAALAREGARCEAAAARQAFALFDDWYAAAGLG